jgi:predicted Zn-dependent protease
LHLLYVFVFLGLVGAGLSPVEARTSINKEIEIGRKAAGEIEKEFPVTENKEWLADIDRLGKMLIVNVKRKELPYSFKIIKEQVDGRNEIDAFSLPGGPVYFSERMWRILSNDERVGVLAHEIAHVDKRHAIDTISEMQKRSILATAVLVITGAGSGWWDAADLGNQLYTLKYSRKREREADMLGVDLVVKAKQNPAGLVTAMKKIERMEQESGGTPPKILSTHPPSKERVEYLSKRAMELGVSPAALEPKFVDSPDRLGSVVEKHKKKKTVQISTAKPLSDGQYVAIKKLLWDDKADAMAPTPVARGTVKLAGTQAEISVMVEPGFEFDDIEKGDGIYPTTVPGPPVAANTSK